MLVFWTYGASAENRWRRKGRNVEMGVRVHHLGSICRANSILLRKFLFTTITPWWMSTIFRQRLRKQRLDCLCPCPCPCFCFLPFYPVLDVFITFLWRIHTAEFILGKVALIVTVYMCCADLSATRRCRVNPCTSKRRRYCVGDADHIYSQTVPLSRPHPLPGNGPICVPDRVT